MSRTNNKNIYVSLDGSTFTNIIASGSFSGDGSGLTGVTSTVPQGTVSGSSQLDGTTINNLTGSFTGSFVGDGSGLTGLGALTLPPGVISGSSQLDGTTINNLSGSFSGSFQGDGSLLTGITSTVPSGTVSGSSQVNADDITNFDSNVLDYINTVGVISGSVAGTDITQLNLFTSSIQTEVDGISAQTSSYLTTLPNGLLSGSDQVTSSLDTRYTLSGSISPLPSGVVSGSSQISYISISDIPSGIISGSSQLDGSTFTNIIASGSFSGSFVGDGSQLSGVTSYTDADTLDFINSISVLSGSKTDITSLNTFTSSIQTEVDGLSAQTSSYLTSLPDGTVSGSSQISYFGITDVPQGILSGSHTDITSLNSFTSSIQTEVDSLTSATSSYLTSLPSGLLSGSHTDITSLNQFSSSIQTEVDGLSAQTSSYLTSLPGGVISGSSQIFITSSQVTDYTTVLAGTSNTTAFTPTSDYHPATKIYVDNAISASGGYTDELAQDAVGNILTDTPTIAFHYDDVNSLISASAQGGIVSGSSQVISILGSLNTFSGSIQTQVDGLSSQTSSYLTSLPNGLLSGSDQVTGSLDLRYTLSGSVQPLPDGVVSGSSQVNADTITNFDSNVLEYINSIEVVSGSIAQTDITSLNNFTSSIQTEVNGLSAQTSSYLTSLPDGLVSGSNQLTGSYDLRYALSGSVEYSNITNLPTLISSSDQVTSSLDTRYTLSGSISPLPDGVVSGSSQISYISISDIPSGIVSGSSQINADTITNFDTNVLDYINIVGVLSGSKTDITSLNQFTSSIQSEVDGLSDQTSSYLTTLPDGLLSGSKTDITSLNSYTASNDVNQTTQDSRLTQLETVTGSLSTTYEQRASGTHTLFSGSSQVNADTITNFDTNVLQYINSISVVSGSITQTDITSLNSYTASNDINQAVQDSRLSSLEILTSSLDTTYEQIASGTHTLVSGSSQLTGSYDLRYALSGSTGVSDYTQLTNIPSGIVSGSSQLTGSYDTRYTLSGSVQPLPNGLVSGSSQINYPNISNIPSGIVSGSTQLDGSTFTNVIISGSFSGSYVGDGSGLTGITSTVPQGTISGSQQITAFGFISESAPQLLSYTASVGELTITDGNTISLGWEFVDTGTGFTFGTPDEKLIITGNVTLEQAEVTGSEYTFPPQTGLLTLGSGSIGSIPKFITEYQIGDSLISETGSVVTINGSGYFTGDVSASNFTGSFYGDGTNLTGVTSYTDTDTLNFLNSINVVSGSSQLTGSYDTRYERTGRGIVSGSSQITYSGISGISANIVSGSSQITYSGISGIPNGIVSGSSQLTGSYDLRYTLSGSISPLPAGIVSGSSQITYSGINGIPSGIVSGSSQVNADTITNFDANVLQYINSIEVVSGSITQTDITQLNLFTSSIQIEVDGLSAQTSSYLTSLPTGLLSGSSQLTSSFDTRYLNTGGDNVISGSSQLTGSYDTRYERQGRGIVSGSSQVSYLQLSNIPSGIVSGSSQVSFTTISNKPSGLVSGSSQVSYVQLSNIPGGIVSGSSQLTASLDTRYDARYAISGSVASIPTGTISGSAQITALGFISSSVLPSGVVSGSSQLTSSYDLRYELQGRGIVSGSSQITYSGINGIPSGIVSSSAQLTTEFDVRYLNTGGDNVISGSSQLTGSYDLRYELQGRGIVSGSSQVSFLSISNVPNGLISGSSQVSFTTISNKPSGLVSGSSQVSFLSISNVPSGLISSSNQITSLVVGDHGTPSTDEVVNVCYGTSATPPSAATVTEGALYIQYIA